MTRSILVEEQEIFSHTKVNKEGFLVERHPNNAPTKVNKEGILVERRPNHPHTSIKNAPDFHLHGNPPH